jgi:hypothetical protein
VTHCDWHTTIQTELRRPPGRTYGARYQAKKPTTTTESPAESVNPTLTRSSGSLENPLSKRLATAQVNPSANSNATASKTGADPQLQKILQSFPPYEGDGIEKSNSADPELKCRDCEFLFRSS